MTFSQFLEKYIAHLNGKPLDLGEVVRDMSGDYADDLGVTEIARQCRALAAPIPDYETPARAAGWEKGNWVAPGRGWWTNSERDGETYQGPAPDLCKEYDLEPILRTPTEFYIVSSGAEPDWEATAKKQPTRVQQHYETAQEFCEARSMAPLLKPALAEWLRARGERVLEFGGMMVWARAPKKVEERIGLEYRCPRQTYFVDQPLSADPTLKAIFKDPSP